MFETDVVLILAILFTLQVFLIPQLFFQLVLSLPDFLILLSYLLLQRPNQVSLNIQRFQHLSFLLLHTLNLAPQLPH